jgi:hypothetical protein
MDKVEPDAGKNAIGEFIQMPDHIRLLICASL